jgi:nitrate reductase assembly molybdenum cofactor insertion protein NarJ
MTAPGATAEELRRRGAVLVLFARALGPGPWGRERAAELRALRRALVQLGDLEAAGLLAGLRAGRRSGQVWAWLFEQGRVSPYEMSYLRPGLGGHLGRIADVAGFARAFGLAVRHERPDHVCAEVELAAFLTLGEAEALARGDDAGAAVFGAAAAAFLRDHLGGWLDLLADRVRAAAPTSPYPAVIAALDRFVAAEAARRGFRPHRPERIDAPGPLGAAPDADDTGPLRCPGCPGPVADPDGAFGLSG